MSDLKVCQRWMRRQSVGIRSGCHGLHLLPKSSPAKAPELYLRPRFQRSSKFPVLNPTSGIQLEAIGTHDSRTQVLMTLGRLGAHEDE